MRRLFDRLQFLARLEANSLPRRNADLGTGARVTADAGLPRTHVEYAKAAQLYAVALRERFLHALEDGFHRQLGLRLGDAGFVDNLVDNIQLNHEQLPVTPFEQLFLISAALP